MTAIQFAPWSSDIELSFYSALASRKINFDRLDDAARKLLGRYEIRPNDPAERSARMQIHSNAFAVDDLPHDHYRAEGILKNVNTVEEYKSLDRTAIIEQAARSIWDGIVDGTIFSCPSLLSSFYAIFFADLKKYKFTYHFAFPALHSIPAWKLAEDEEAQTRLEPTESRALYDSVQTWKYSVDARQHGFFLAKRVPYQPSPSEAQHQAQPAVRSANATNITNEKSASTSPSAGSLNFHWVIGSLSAYEAGFFDDIPSPDRLICFADPSTYPGNPGWPLRNLLVLVKYRWQLHDIRVLCYRDKHSRREHPHSLVLRLISPASESQDATQPASVAPEAELRGLPMPRVTGWERSLTGKLTSRTTDLSSYLDPGKLADQAVDLNLKLMKWRIAPSLDLATIQATRCLLLGAGTLGSYVARNLLGWGVRHLTFVDNGKVSYSNPVRQPLFRFEDCTNGGRAKAERAAEALKEIYPGVHSEGIPLSVPMAGHPVLDEQGELRVKGEFDRLKNLVDEHDVIFLLMDTRESRWLPTVMGKSAGKVVVNAALGFDSYVVVRHGLASTSGDSSAARPRPNANADMVSDSQILQPSSSSSPETKDQGAELGCYFCNDVVAPADSLSDRTLDQQCTVTRPGIAAIASALAVELLVSVLQHPLGARAPAPISRQAPRDTFTVPASPTAAPSSTQIDMEEMQHPLGLVPHSIRGFLSTWDNILTSGPAYNACSACSPGILQRYEQDGWDFVKRAINERGWIEEVSGLKEVQRRAEEAAKMLEEEEELEEARDESDGELL